MEKESKPQRIYCDQHKRLLVALAAAEAGVDYIGYGMDGPSELAVPKLKELRSAAPNVLICSAMFKESAFSSDALALRDSVRLLEAGADVIYCTGMPFDRIKRLTKAHIPCVGHLGLTPYFSSWTGGYRAVGKTLDQAKQVYENAMELNEAGAFFAEVECIPHQLAKIITEKVDFLTLSMGSGADCDGQFLFACDLLGATNAHYPRHCKRYDDFYGRSVRVFQQFIEETNTGIYPEPKHMIEMPQDSYQAFLKERSLQR